MGEWERERGLTGWAHEYQWEQENFSESVVVMNNSEQIEKSTITRL